MRRTQILMDDQQYRALKAWAHGTDRSVSEIVRDAVARLLGERGKGIKKCRIDQLCGMVRDPGGPAGRDHDRVLYGKR